MSFNWCGWERDYVGELRMASSCLSTSSRAPGMILEDVFELCRRDKGEIGKWLRRHEVIGDFSGHRLPIMHATVEA